MSKITNSTLKINKLFSDEKSRSVSELSKLYENRDLLVKNIHELSREWINESNLISKKVLLKPNWVKHSSNPTHDICLRTNDNFVLAALEVVLNCKPKEVVIGDAPIQGCIWDKMITSSFLGEIRKLSDKYKIPVTVKDFRRVTFDPKLNKIDKDFTPINNYTLFDLGTNSYLEPISLITKNLFRVTQYNPDRFKESHRAGMHKYCITNDLFDADVVISLPKIKTHQKAGMTGALKNLVGLNGDKDYLPHHRIGGTNRGGDCYPGGNLLRFWAEMLQDTANRNIGKTIYRYWLRLSAVLWRLSLPKKVHHLGAAWYGNDTIWRMVMDLNKIAIYGKKNGEIADEQQRIVFSLCDGIIGGQGDGPLNPEPLPFGIISFSTDAILNDISMATLMGIEYKKLPLLLAAQIINQNTLSTIYLDGELIAPHELTKIAITAKMPPGWLDYHIQKD